MASRTIPTCRYGKVPALDRLIQRGSSHPQHRWIVGARKFPNITQARQYVSSRYGISADIEWRDVKYTPGTGHTHNRVNPAPISSNESTKPVVVVDPAVQKQPDIKKLVDVKLHTKKGLIEVHGQFSLNDITNIYNAVMA